MEPASNAEIVVAASQVGYDHGEPVQAVGNVIGSGARPFRVSDDALARGAEERREFFIAEQISHRRPLDRRRRRLFKRA